MTDENIPDSPEISAALMRGEYSKVIKLVRAAVAANPVAALSDPVIKEWLGRRYRFLFLNEAANDPGALRAAKVPLPINLIDRRSTSELLAARFLKRVSREEAQAQLPVPKTPNLAGRTLLFVPGEMSGLLPVRAFQSVWPKIEDRFGLRVLAADVHPVRSSKANEADIIAALDKGLGIDADSQEINSKKASPPDEVILMGYSKGATDALRLLVDKPKYRDRIQAFISWGGVIGGSYIANDIEERLRDEVIPKYPLSGQIAKMLRRVVPVVQADRIHSRLDQYDVKGAIHSLTTAEREAFLRDNVEVLTEMGIPTFTVAGVTSVLEVPYYQAIGALQLNNYDKNNDMLVTVGQTRIPVRHSTELATFRAHHWDMAYDPFPWFTRMGSLNVDHRFARYPAMAALLIFLSELGLI